MIMTLSDIANAFRGAGIVPLQKTFKELSKSNADPANPVYCVNAGGYCEKLIGIDFDDVTSRYYRQIPHTVASPDALYIWQDEIFLIEFKTGGAPAEDLYRKFYDGSILLVESGALSFDECRTHVTGVLVWSDADHAGNHDMPYDLPGTSRPAGSPRYEYAVPKDLSLMKPSSDFRILSSYLLDKVYVLTPNDFDAFAAVREWK